MPPIVNIAAYQFAHLNKIAGLRADLRQLTHAHSLKGTILLSGEGINIFVAGARGGVDVLLNRVRQIEGFAHIAVKESFSDSQPFNRMLVKIKKEIIAFGVDAIDPRRYSSRRLPPTLLKRWLDEGKSVTLLDTRNDFEVQTGTFKNAMAIGVKDFRDFPAAVKKLPADLKDQPVITFCTGGIRCEKAAPYLESQGFADVYQLDGGILKYFEECGQAHYEGDCFVFDQRVALNGKLEQGNLKQCFVCLAILSPQQQQSSQYIIGKSCPECFQTDEAKSRQLRIQRQQAILRAVTPLPGSVAYENVRPISVPLRLDGTELLNFLDAMHTHLSREQWREACDQGRLRCRGQAVAPGQIMRAGERILHTMPSANEPDVASDIQILHEDDAFVVINKPAPLPMHPCGRFSRNTLTYILKDVFQPIVLRPAHRLDANTTGVVVFSKTRQLANAIQSQFQAGTVNKTYLARVHGHPVETKFECHASISSEAGAGGLRLPDTEGESASTEFQLLQKLDDGTSILEVRPMTGRTNQIRIHLWKLGLPIMGDPTYLPGKELGTHISIGLQDQPLCLHSLAIEFMHPLTELRATYQAPAPLWGAGYAAVLKT